MPWWFFAFFTGVFVTITIKSVQMGDVLFTVLFAVVALAYAWAGLIIIDRQYPR